MGTLSGKKYLITGVASNRSIAWGVAKAMHAQGAELAFTYMGDRLRERVVKLAAEVGSELVLPCDVSDDAQISQLFAELGQTWANFDGFLHAIAFAPGEQLQGDFVDAITREGFGVAHDISAYSFAAMARSARPLLNPGASLLTLTYVGSERTMPNYNLMGVAKASLEATTRYMAVAMGPQGIRVNAISAGPIKTLAASGIGDFRKILDFVASSSAIPGNITTEQVGNTAAFLASEHSSGITGQVIYVDNGFNITGMPQPQAGQAGSTS